MSAFQDLIRFITDGEAVRAGTANRAPMALDNNVRYLKELLEQALLGATLIIRDQLVDASVAVGQPVYFNATSRQFEKAVAGVDTNGDGELVTAATSYVWGLVYRKLASDRADIVLEGCVPLDLSQAVTGTVTTGLYYLSTATAGKLTQTPQAMPVPVCMVGEEGTTNGQRMVLISKTFRDAFDAHRHFRFELQCNQAADSDEEGWLPADDAVFAGKAPANAKYGYNLSVSAVKNYWPPVPVSNAYLEWHQGTATYLLGQGVPAGDMQGDLVQFTDDGIWWLSDCAGDEPWSAELTSLSEGEGVGDCPRDPVMKLILFFTKPVFFTGQTAVLSLETPANGGLAITCRDSGDPANTGHLKIALDLGLTIDETAQSGATVLKTISANKFKAGRVVEGIKAAGDNITLTSDLGALPGSGVAQGIVSIAVDTEIGGSELAVQTVRLNGAEEEFYADVIALKFRSGVQSDFRGRVFVPAKNALPTGTKLKLRFRFMGRAAGNVPSDMFTLSYRRIPKPSALLTPVALPLSDTEITLDTTCTLSGADQYFDVDSESFEIAAGDVVLFTLQRNGDTDGYAADVFVLQENGILVAA